MKRILISGCCGFIGQNLVKRLNKDFKLIGIDNFFSSNRDVLNNFKNYDNFNFIEANISKLPLIEDKIDYIINLACPASPPKYMSDPFFTMDTNFNGTLNLLNLAKKNNSIFIQASTSEVYGDPLVHPQIETYRGNVNPIGKRSCYDEGKRIAETLCYEFREKHNLQTRIIRIFNTYGPGMDINDGRVISNFMVNTIKGYPLVIYGNGNQTRSFCYIEDLISGILECMNVDFDYPINIGNDKEFSLNELANIFIRNLKADSIKKVKSVPDDPKLRRPNINLAKKVLGWSPNTSLQEGLNLTYSYFKNQLIKDE